MSHLYKAPKAYQEQLLRDAQPNEVGDGVKPRKHRLVAAQLLKTLRALRQAKATQESQAAPSAWMQT